MINVYWYIILLLYYFLIEATTHVAGPLAGSGAIFTFSPLMMVIHVFSIGLCFCRHGGVLFVLYIFQGFDHLVRNKFRRINFEYKNFLRATERNLE